jgi:release factor glutamine methyltransferase
LDKQVLREYQFISIVHVLIPRPETESLVYWIKSREPDDLAILDICSGSGCIAFALENHINARVTAWDISNKALTVAKQTAASIGSNVSFSQVDILKQLQTQDRWDVIVSNPPYVLGGGEVTNSLKCT